MSLRVLVIPEDPTHNGYILRPLVQTILTDVGRPAARVEVLTNPRLGGYEQAVLAIRKELTERYSHLHLWLFFPDADCASEPAMKKLEDDTLAKGIRLLCCPARPEIEIFACAGYRDELGLPWERVRAHPRLKEEVFAPLLVRRGDQRRAGQGRDVLISTAVKNLAGLYQLCPELKRLRDRLVEIEIAR